MQRTITVTVDCPEGVDVEQVLREYIEQGQERDRERAQGCCCDTDEEPSPDQRSCNDCGLPLFGCELAQDRDMIAWKVG